MKYLKKFSTHSDYATFTGSTDFILPNVSVCVNEDEVHFNQIVSDTHEYVDLGLPSGILWATENIKDANGNELFFAWGETSGYTAEQVGTDKNFSWEDYEFGTLGIYSKYNSSDGKTELEPEDDAATANWGSDWKMPNRKDFSELRKNTTLTWTEINGIQGAKLTSKVEGHTNKFLFFPAVGGAGDGEVTYVGDGCSCWFSDLYSVSDAWQLDFTNESFGPRSIGRCYGYSIRPVRVETNLK